jgi:hypothetical protein
MANPIPNSLRGNTQPMDMAAGSNPLAFTIQTQEQPKWCWAAVAASVGNFLGTGDQDWQQCDVAAHCLQAAADCCEHPNDFNTDCELEPALKYTHCLARPVVNGRLSMADVVREIDGRRPICLRMRWFSDDPRAPAHFLVIFGYDLARGSVDVADPEDGTTGPQALENFPGSYNGGGEWTATYCT